MSLPSTTGPSIATSAIPRPRSPQPDVTTEAPAPRTEPAPALPEPRTGEVPWPEPWRHSRAARPRSEFWDVETASWHSRGPYPDRSASR